MIKLPPLPKYLGDEYNQLIITAAYTEISDYDLIHKIYDYMDKFNSIYVKTFAVCSKGCSYCCHIPITITYVEAKYIQQCENLEINNKTMQFNESISNTISGKYNSVCPFLNSHNNCSIYNLRPFCCRSFHVLDDPSLCKKMESQYIFGAPLFIPHMPPLNPYIDISSQLIDSIDFKFGILTNLFRLIFLHNIDFPFKDLREFFSNPEIHPHS
ncbi:MAG: YkgJ family cysteine cluster protein [bacterium]